MDIATERARRDAIWSALHARGGPLAVPPALVRELGIYGGAAGVWVNAEHTRAVDPNGVGVTVGLLHTGKAYPDDLDATGVLYHYPSTERPGHDRAEIDATKAAQVLQVPVFVITPGEDSHRRNVHRGFVVDSDDESRVFLVSFNERDVGARLPSAADEENAPFVLTDAKTSTKRLTSVRHGQPAFKFRVFRRYGPQCAVCSINVSELLDAAHIREKKDQGSDDARNGLVFCATHHRAFDRGFFGIEPESLRIVVKKNISSFSSLAVTETSLVRLRLKPHPEALAWRWSMWQNT